ncbi:restriction endonuclease subunit S [Gordonibacter sp.]|uniref:restriction endonuclease subunit S n=1 Tax=Gordonibacter sp. TaxID=1968902 RepID=UPI002FC5CB69
MTLLTEYVSLINGKKRPDNTGTVPVYGGNGIMGTTEEGNARNSVIIGRVGAYCGSVYYEPGECWISDNAIGVSAKDGSEISFIYYLLSNLHLGKMQIGTSQPLLTQGILKTIEAPIPDLAKQKRIARLLQELDLKISLNNRINDYLAA